MDTHMHMFVECIIVTHHHIKNKAVIQTCTHLLRSRAKLLHIIL